MKACYQHISVLKTEVIDTLIENTAGIYVDGTLGGGGHTGAILEKLDDKGRILAIDKDKDALTACREKFQAHSDQIRVLYGDFMRMRELLNGIRILHVDGILLDLGVSSYQIDTAGRGFSYTQSGPLDMRMDASSPVSAYDLVNNAEQSELRRIIRVYGEERLAGPIARAIAEAREGAPIKTTGELVNVIKLVIRHRPLYRTCARVFQAFRIAVNSEIETLGLGLTDAVGLLSDGGRLGVISYHSLEDRIVKRTFLDLARSCICPPEIPQCMCNHEAKVKVITKKPVYPTAEEIRFNPRARSARLRFVERLPMSSPNINDQNRLNQVGERGI
ncbi:MAG: 16S rRNA (cytosine(1402)-N(4))-methyltransferase RsmH [Gemmatimonadota bacterium]|nr:16S rRNA (cytosine(1402)-N(4))-methyltransferase RsmH [Gemmatimonadota bacterium]